MPPQLQVPDATPDLTLARARGKVLAREDREMKAALIRIREKAGLTQKQVAELLGVTQQAIQKLERYDSDPKLSTLRRYANAVGALVSHHVDPDIGQSLALAATPQWERSMTIAPRSIPPSRASSAPEPSGLWSTSTNLMKIS